MFNTLRKSPYFWPVVGLALFCIAIGTLVAVGLFLGIMTPTIILYTVIACALALGGFSINMAVTYYSIGTQPQIYPVAEELDHAPVHTRPDVRYSARLYTRIEAEHHDSEQRRRDADLKLGISVRNTSPFTTPWEDFEERTSDIHSVEDLYGSGTDDDAKQSSIPDIEYITDYSTPEVFPVHLRHEPEEGTTEQVPVSAVIETVRSGYIPSLVAPSCVVYDSDSDSIVSDDDTPDLDAGDFHSLVERRRNGHGTFGRNGRLFIFDSNELPLPYEICKWIVAQRNKSGKLVIRDSSLSPKKGVNNVNVEILDPEVTYLCIKAMTIPAAWHRDAKKYDAYVEASRMDVFPNKFKAYEAIIGGCNDPIAYLIDDRDANDPYTSVAHRAQNGGRYAMIENPMDMRRRFQDNEYTGLAQQPANPVKKRWGLFG